MATIDDLPEFTESLGADFYMMRQDTRDVKISKNNIFNIAFPIGYIKEAVVDINPSELGFPGTWRRLDPDTGCLATATGGNIGSFSGSYTQPVELPQHNHLGSTSVEPDHIHSTQWSPSTIDDPILDPLGNLGGVGRVQFQTTTATEPAHEHVATSEPAGTPSATINVAGKRVKMYFWLRES